MGKPFTEALLVGRFQTLHKGHQKLIDTGLLLADRLTIFVGSAQECGTERNPLNVMTRINMIRKIYDDEKRVLIYPLSDLTNENDLTSDWGRYVLNNYRRYIFKNPDIQVYGNDDSRNNWYDEKDLKDSSRFIINRYDIPISATDLRNYMVIDNREEWMKWVDPKLHILYDDLRKELMSVEYYKKQYLNLLKMEIEKSN